MAEPSTVKLPELPEAAIHHEWTDAGFRRVTTLGWDEYQLRAFATSAVLEDRRAREGDGARLDWLEQMANLPGGLLLHDGSETGRTGLGLRPGYLTRTLREAIDAALSSTDGGKDA